MNQKNQSGVFHIGFHKTGTTYLQEHIFPFAVDCQVTKPWSHLSEFYNRESKRYWLHSDESISGKPWGGNVPYGAAFEKNLTSCIEILGINKYILTVRPLNSWTKSLWKQHIHEGGCTNPKNFFNGSDSVINLEDCLMAPKVNWLKQRADVLIISQQELKDDEFAVIEKLSAFTGIQFNLERFKNNADKKESNVGISSKRQVQFLLRANHYNRNLKNLHPRLNLNNRYLRKFGLTPRYIAQRRLANSNQDIFKIDFNLTQKQLYLIEQDWEEMKTHL